MKKKIKDKIKEQRDFKYWNEAPKMVPEDIFSLDNKAKEKILEDWQSATWTGFLQNKDQQLANIREIPCQKIEVKEFIMDRLKEMLHHYVTGYWPSTIALGGMVCEFIAQILLENNNVSKEFNNLFNKLRYLKNNSIIDESEYKLLDEVRDIRNKYIHLEIIDNKGTAIKKDSLIVLKNIIQFLNKNPVM